MARLQCLCLIGWFRILRTLPTTSLSPHQSLLYLLSLHQNLLSLINLARFKDEDKEDCFGLLGPTPCKMVAILY